ncbi:RsbR, positive regulator of sigma-B [Labilithrix luteola]|uniref:RsbR, positive regulator of sigma-B n=1 Tax=Labilithrix luteola TaxID=1391654 RepID=A0A0K1Q3C9_9BACT|nr:STAS domain-containing protein [Labilithrix luteola]AKU99874.1 RsbR, positive regulator of sigma-B [Labilithrix luteola]
MSDLIKREELESALLEHVADVLIVLADVGAGDYSARVKNTLPEGHPLFTLTAGINEMISSLAAEQQKSASYRSQLEEKLAMIETQRAAIRELSTPIIEVWEGILCLPVVGVLDSTRSAEMTEALLTAIVEKKARCSIIDITGIQVMDTATADHFLRMAKSVKLLGSECMLTGVHPNIAQTIVHMGVDLSEVVTHRNLRNALTHYLRRSGVAS